MNHPIVIGLGLLFLITLAVLCITKLKHCRTRRHGSKVAALALLFCALAPLHASEPTAELYAAGKFTVSPFASARVVDSHAEFGGGLAASYALTPRLAVEGDVITEGIDDSNWQDAITEAGGALKYYFPIKETGFAPYLIAGYKRDLIAHENRVAADARLNHGFEQELSELGNRVDVRVGVGWSF